MCVFRLTMNQCLPMSISTLSYFFICVTFSPHYFLRVANVFSHGDYLPKSTILHIQGLFWGVYQVHEVYQQARRNAQPVNISWLLLARNLAKAFLHPSTNPLVIKKKGRCVHTYIKQQLSPQITSVEIGGGGPQNSVRLCWWIEGDFNQSIPTVLL